MSPSTRTPARDIYIWNRLGDPPTLRRLSEPSNGSDLPGASGAPVLSGNGNRLLFRTQAVNVGGGSGGAIVAGAGEDGKSTTAETPSPTNDAPPPPDIPPPPPSGSTEDPSTSGDGNTTGNTTEPDPGTGGGEPVVEVIETPRTPTARRRSAGSRRARVRRPAETSSRSRAATSRPTRPCCGTASIRLHLREQQLAAGRRAAVGFDQTVSVRVIMTGELSNAVQYTYTAGLTAPSITSFATVPPTNPVSGPVAGATHVRIIGTGFSRPDRPVRPDGGHCGRGDVERHHDQRAHAAGRVAGPVPIVVQNSNGTIAVSGSPFTYTFAGPVGAPSISPLTAEPRSGDRRYRHHHHGNAVHARRHGHGRRCAGDRRAGAEQHADRGGDAGRCRGARQRGRDDGERPVVGPDVRLRPAGRARPDVRRHRHRSRRCARRVGDPVRVQPGGHHRRRGRHRRRRPHERPGVHGADASARALHALPRGGRERPVLRHPRRAGQSGGVAGARALPLPEGYGRAGPARTSWCPPRRAGRSTCGCSRGWRSGSISTVLESDVQVVLDRTMRWDNVRASAPMPRRACRRRRWVVSRRGGDARPVRSLLPAPEPEPDAGGSGAHPLPAAVGLADRADYRRAAEQALDRLDVDPAAWPRVHRRLGGDREPERDADHRRARDVLVGGRHVRGRPRQRRRDRARRRSGSSPRAPPASSTCSSCSPTRARRRRT